MQNWADFQNALAQGAGQIRDAFQQQAARTGVHVSVNRTRASAGPESIGTDGQGVIDAHGSRNMTLGQMQRLRGGVILNENMREQAFRLEQAGLQASATPVLGLTTGPNYEMFENLQYS